MDAVHTYLSHAVPRGSLDQLLAEERILFCCQSRLLATVWVRAERGRHSAGSAMPEHLAGACTTLVVTTQRLEQGAGLELEVIETDGFAQRQPGDHPGEEHQMALVADGAVLTQEAGELTV